MSREWIRVLPVPAQAEQARPAAHSVRGRPAMQFRFVNANGLVGYVYRFEGSDGTPRDEPLCYFVNENAEYEWRWRVFDEPRPLYGAYRMEWLNAAAPVIVTDDPACVDAIADYMPGFVCVAWSGGLTAVKKTDWKILENRNVILWPTADADISKEDGAMIPRSDQPLTRASKQIATQLVRFGCDVRMVQLPEPADIEAGFNIASAKAAKWNGADLLTWMSDRVKTVFAKQVSVLPKKDPKRGASSPAGGDSDDDDEPTTSVAKLLKRFTLIYGTDTAYDHVERDIIKVSHMGLAFGADWIKAWLANNKRHTVSRTNVVFDPTETVDERTHVNLFFGMPIEPDRSKRCDRLIALLNFLCNEDQGVFEWVLKWIAYPLQNPGAKMETAVLMHGEEGSGKNQFWKAVAQIFGPYGSIITQNELESQFNTWASRKLFLIANEVVSRSEIREHKGRLKNYITEDEIQINEKMLPLRTERNQMNFVFFSNETIPLVLDRTDRRYQVIWTPPPLEPAYYKAVDEQLQAGAAAGLYAYLLELDLGDFDRHTKPISTKAKLDLIDMGKTAPELFFDHWKADMTPLPFVAATSEDLYKAFLKWCQLNGERHPPSLTKFGRTMARCGLRSELKLILVPGGSTTAKRQRTVYWTGEPNHPEDLIPWLEKHMREFHMAFEEWARPSPMGPA